MRSRAGGDQAEGAEAGRCGGHSNKLASVTASGTQDGAEVVQWTDKDKPNQQFRLG
ncbi:RICIN domain-containing protein [Streptomyces zagrosensis]|uniref:Ricin B lectin domain-containing protein n=1 Tax=Streptomyces zagrosensis TaxID=1042984 RepID=A0A7W9QAA2_9ACTN|nr:RICIN domain-containing protein [Streptomyces zagrosensis]MBB5936521.1 hypothetical protein [Streptomyces zagrosensis]